MVRLAQPASSRPGQFLAYPPLSCCQAERMSGQGLLERILNDQSIVTGMLIVIAVCSLTFAYRHLRPLASGRHLPSHSRGPAAVGGRWTGGDPWMSPPPRAAAGNPRPAGRPEPAAVHPAHAEDHPSWPGRSGPGAVHSDHPVQPQADLDPPSRRRARSGTRARYSWPPGFSMRLTRRRPRFATRPAARRRRRWRMRGRRPPNCSGRPRTRPQRSSLPPSSRPPRFRRPS